MKNFFKRLFHRHKYTILDKYPPRANYGDKTYGFIIRCECGHSKLLKLYDIEQVRVILDSSQVDIYENP